MNVFLCIYVAFVTDGISHPYQMNGSISNVRVLGAVIEDLPGVWITGGKGNLFQGNKGQILRGTKTILGDREHKKTFSILREQGNKPI